MSVGADKSADAAASANSGPMFDVDVRRDVRIPTVDPDVTLSADVFLPVDAGIVPALVMVLPYRKDFTVGADLEASHRWFAARGYASLLVELRGIGSSDGTPRPKFDQGEGDDVIAAIEWAAAQSWCSGSVGMWGHSSGAFLTLRGASLSPPALKAIIPSQCPLDPGWEAVHHDGARVDLHQRALWSGSMLLDQLVPPLYNYTSVREQRRWQERLHETEPFLLDLARGPRDPVWRKRAIDPSPIEVPTFFIGGWRDLYARGIVRAYEQVRAPKKLLIGPWTHSYPHKSPFAPIDFLRIALRWWNYWLGGVDNGVMNEPPVTLYTMGDNPEWRSYDSWPPATDELFLATDTDTKLTTPRRYEDQAASQIAEYQPDPTIGALSGLWGIPNPGIGLPLDQHDDDLRGVTATSDPLPDAVMIAGCAEVLVRTATVDTASTQSVERLVVRLSEVDADGRSSFIALGVLCPEKLSASHRVALRPTMHRVPAGHRLRVALSDSDFPRLTPPRNPSLIQIARIELHAPTMPSDAGVKVDMPAVEANSAQQHPPGRWTITRDPIHDEIEVEIGWSSTGAHTSQGHQLDRHTDVRAKVRRPAPEAAVTIGTHRATIRMNTGEEIEVTANVRCTQALLWARGEVTIDGLTRYSRTWEAALGDG